MEICAHVSNKHNFVVEIYVFSSERSYWPPLENVVYHVMTQCLGDINTESALFGHFNP